MKMHHTFFLGATCVLIAGTAPAAASAEPTLADPTRPLGLAQQHTAPPARAALVTAAPPPALPPALPRLQSVQVSAQGGSSALVDGRLVRVGERLGELTVVAIDAQGIVLRGARSDQRLALLPGIAKTVSARGPLAVQPVVATRAAP